MRPKSWQAALALALAAGAALVALLLLRGGVERRAAGERISFPPPQPAADSFHVLPQDFAGAEACASCHATQYAAWSGSTHGRAGGPPGPDVLIARFDGRAIRFRDAVVLPTASGGEYRFVVRQGGRPEQVFRVDGVVGGGHMVGGGTQGFVSRWPDGTVRFLPFDFARREGVWFCNTNTRKGAGWTPITPDMALADCGDWPPVRVLGDEPRFANCQGCHGSQILIEPDPGEGWRTSIEDLRINCESCHGPGRRHIELARAGRIPGEPDIGLRSLVTLDEDASLAVCFRCHAVKDQLRTGYLPGEGLAAHYALSFPSLGESPYHPDGRIRTFAYQEGHLWSDCYVSGTMTCVDCHDPHAQDYRDAAGRALVGRFDDGQCLACHPSKQDVERHTRHPAGTEASRCTTCHMPFFQEAEIGTDIRFTRSDHTISIPRPVWDSGLGLEGACRQCHADSEPAALQRQAEAWWGELKPHPEAVAGLASVSRATSRLPTTSRAEAARRLLHPAPSAGGEAARFAALAGYFESYLEPDQPELEREAERALRALAGEDDVALRSLALASLHLARGEDPETRAFLAERLRALGPAEDRAVRARWSLALGYLADRERTGGSAARAVTIYGKALEVRPGEPRLLMNLGLAWRAAGDPGRAVESFRTSLATDSLQPLGWANLGSALAALGDARGALDAYERALRINPAEPIAWANLGNLHLRHDRPAEAAAAYERAVALDPSLAQTQFYLARANIVLRRYEQALAAARRGLEFAPADPIGKAMVRDLERALGSP